MKAKVGKKRVLVIPKKIAERVGINEGTIVELKEEGNKIIIEPLRDAVWLSIYGEKITKVTLKELEEESFEQQKKYLEK